MDYIVEIGKQAKAACAEVMLLTQTQKNAGLRSVAEELRSQADYLMEENAKDVARARECGMKESLVDRLKLTKARIDGMAEGLEQIVLLEDPVGETMETKLRPNGLRIGKRRVPIGVIGIIYESRPNVTAASPPSILPMTRKSETMTTMRARKPDMATASPGTPMSPRTSTKRKPPMSKSPESR